MTESDAEFRASIEKILQEERGTLERLGSEEFHASRDRPSPKKKQITFDEALKEAIEKDGWMLKDLPD